MIKYYLFFLLVIAMYGGLYWFSVGSSRGGKRTKFLFTSCVVITSYILFMLVNLFFALFAAVLVMSVVAYISSQNKVSNSRQILHGAVGGLWLSVPIYAYLVAST